LGLSKAFIILSQKDTTFLVPFDNNNNNIVTTAMRNTLRKAMPASMRRDEIDEDSGRTSQSDSTLAANNNNELVMADLSSTDGSQEKQERPQASRRKTRADGKRELTEDDAPEVLGFAFPSWKKWWIITACLSRKSCGKIY
jgi:hypothetical protein